MDVETLAFTRLTWHGSPNMASADTACCFCRHYRDVACHHPGRMCDLVVAWQSQVVSYGCRAAILSLCCQNLRHELKTHETHPDSSVETKATWNFHDLIDLLNQGRHLMGPCHYHLQHRFQPSHLQHRFQPSFCQLCHRSHHQQCWSLHLLWHRRLHRRLAPHWLHPHQDQRLVWLILGRSNIQVLWFCTMLSDIDSRQLANIVIHVVCIKCCWQIRLMIPCD